MTFLDDERGSRKNNEAYSRENGAKIASLFATLSPEEIVGLLENGLRVQEDIKEIQEIFLQLIINAGSYIKEENNIK
jgi:hypothetical protein